MMYTSRSQSSVSSRQQPSARITCPQDGNNRMMQRSQSTPMSSRQNPTAYVPSIGNFAATGIPGYTGFIPGKNAENVCASTFQRSNELALHACDMRATPQYEMPPQSYNPHGVSAHRRGYDMPGYTGFVPGKYADNVFGNIFTRSNAISAMIKGVQFEQKRNWIENLHSQAPPMANGTGVVGYTGYNGATNRAQEYRAG